MVSKSIKRKGWSRIIIQDVGIEEYWRRKRLIIICGLNPPGRYMGTEKRVYKKSYP